MKRQWDVYATDATRDIAFLVISSDEVNALFPYVTVVPVAVRAEGREVYPIEAVLPDVFTSGTTAGSSIALIHQIRTLKTDHLTHRRGSVDNEDVRSAVRNAMTAYFAL